MNPEWHGNSFFDSLISQIPSIDSDSSLSDNEDEVSIYRRPPAPFFPEETEDLECLSLGDPEVEELLKSVIQPPSCWTNETFCNQRGSGNLHLQSSRGATLETHGAFDGSLKNATKAGNYSHYCDPVECNRETSVDQHLDTTHKLNILETGNVEKDVPSQGTKKPQKQQFPILSLKHLEHWDLDQVLENLKEHGHSVKSTEAAEPKKIQPDTRDGGNGRSEGGVMERLAAFCKKQECEDIETKAIRASVKTLSKLQRLFVKCPADFSRNIDGWTRGFNNIAAELKMNHQKPPTIYIDLRNPEPPTKDTTPHNISSLPRHLNIPDQPKHTPSTEKSINNIEPGAARGKGDVTGKSLLLQKIRQANQNRTEGSENEPARKQAPVDSAGELQSVKARAKQRPQHSSSGISCGEVSQPPEAANASSPTAKGGLVMPQTEGRSPSQNRAATQLHQSEQVQREQAKQRAQRQQLQKLLQTFRPQRSTGGTELAAEGTDVLYDSEASCLPPVNTLPTDLQSRERLLLTVSLSSPGLAAERGQGKAQTVESASSKSHVYNALIAWFLSLAGPGPSRGEGSTGVDAPFRVAGLQQLWTEDGLVLYICAVSHEESPSLSMKPTKRAAERSRSVFHQRVFKFLSQTSLRAVTPWLPQLNRLLERQAHTLHVHLPASSLDCFVSVNPDKKALEKAFGESPGFYWQTMDTQDQICQKAETMSSLQTHTEVAIAVGYRTLFLDPLATHHTLQLLLSSSLDVCGFRLLYPPHELLANSTVSVAGERGEDGALQPVLALALRGPLARSVWQDITGPSDPQLARKTDPTSINALHCHGRDQPLLYSPRLASRVHWELCLWFAGRAPKDGLQSPSPGVTDRVDTGDHEGSSWYETRSPATLCATVKADVFLLVSPAVPPCCYSRVLSTCAKRGFSLKGLQRVQLSSKQAQCLGLTSQQVSVFCGAPAVPLDGEQVELSSCCLVLLVRRESALRHCASLCAGLMNELAVQGLIGCIQVRLADDVKVDPGWCFHTVAYSESLLHSLGGHMWTVPDFSSVVLSNHSYPSSSETEQVVILTLTGQDIMGQGMGLLHRVLRGDIAGSAGEGFELLALKWLPALSWQQAREVSPFEVGDRQWQSSVVGLASSPALVCALRRVNAFAALRRLLPHDYPGNLNALLSPTPEMAFRQASLFFTEGELIPDHSARTSLRFLPPSCINVPGSQSQSFFSCMTEGPQPLITLALFKPGVWSFSLGKILSKVRQSGFTVVGLRVVLLDPEAAASLMPATRPQDPSEIDGHVEYLSSGLSLALCLQRVNAVRRLLELLGPEDPVQARAQDQFLWRARHGTDRLHNGIYASGSYQKAVRDVKRMFPDGLCCTETAVMRHEQIPCLSSDTVASLEREQSHTITSLTKNKPSKSLIMASGLNGGPLVRSALCQTTCLLMPSNLLQRGHPPLHLDLLEQLLRAGCHLVAGRLCVLDEAQGAHVAESLRPAAEGGGVLSASLLSEGPCLILALQRDNVVTCFDLILESICRERPDVGKVRNRLLHPINEKKAVKLLCYFFDVLSSDSHHSIEPNEPAVPSCLHAYNLHHTQGQTDCFI